MRPAHDLITWSGIIGGAASPETWAFGVRCEPTVAADPATLKAAATSAFGAFAQAGGLLEMLGTNVFLTKVVVAKVATTGLWMPNDDGSFQKGEDTMNVNGTNGQNALPAQSALVVSLVTARAGASGKGRFFLPLGRRVLDEQGRLDTAAADDFANRSATFLDGIRDTIAFPVVASSKGFLSRVTAVRVGRVVDTQRSRRRSLVEAYSTVALPPQ
jgi:hypothetical protein